jgi:hypothetical protein
MEAFFQGMTIASLQKAPMTSDNKFALPHDMELGHRSHPQATNATAVSA